MREIQIEKNDRGQRLDKFLQKYLPEASKGFLYKMLRKKNIKLNGARANGNEILKCDDRITIYFSEETFLKFRGGSGQRQYPVTNLDLIYEDENLLIINKPVGMLSQKAHREDISLVEYLLGYLQAGGKWKPGGAFTPGICNRLDRNTSGLVLAGKSLAGLQEMARILKDRSLNKYYYTIVEGQILQPAKIEGYLSKEESENRVRIYDEPADGRSLIQTSYEPIATGRDVTFLRVKLITGKTHQIRSHLGSIGHPVMGDVKYGAERQSGLHHFLLHAGEIEFPELRPPLSELSNQKFEADLPKEFQRWKKKLLN